MSVPTVYNPAGVATAGKSMIGVCTAIADIQAPKLAELQAGTVFECATESFGLGVSAATVSRRKLCDTVAKKQRGNVEYEDMTLQITIDPQATAISLLDIFAPGARVFLFHRPGIAHTTPLAATAQKVQVIEAVVLTRRLDDVTVDDGQEYGATITLMPQAATDLLVSIVA